MIAIPVTTVACALVVCVVAASPLKAESARFTGMASVYAYTGEKTASGQRAHPHGLTAAHRTLAFGTQVRVTNRRNGKSVLVRINDRGPFIKGRVIDVSPRAAAILGFSGVAPVTLAVVGKGG
ncbi:MAG: septal ring lytic transglycosylase RlpA family protein [Pseudorhodoplanes sp.]|nr:septal ring lytic transglycosylase RlpA family protein [Pseudorhodoplanes sp.]